MNLGKNQQKILLLLFSGVAFGLSYSPRSQKIVLDNLSKEWKNINKRSLDRSVNSLKDHKLISFSEKKDGYEAVLTEKGKMFANKISFRKIKISKPKKWDKLWRIVMFDIIEENRLARDTLRTMLKRLEFVELQKSVFVYPYKCEKEVMSLVNFFAIHSSVRFLEANYIDNHDELIRIFSL